MGSFTEAGASDEGGGVPASVHVLTTQAEAGLSAESNLGALASGILAHTVAAGVSTPRTADPALEYVSPAITAPVASATTITLPETGLIVPITGTTQIDFITKPTGNVGRMVILSFGSTINIRHEVAGAPGGAANMTVTPGGSASTTCVFAAGFLLPLIFNGTNWQRVPTGPHWDGTFIFAPNGVISLSLSNSAATLRTNSSRILTVQAASLQLKHDVMLDVQSRLLLTQGSVASASQVTFPIAASCLCTGTTTMNTFVATGWTEGMEISLEFDGVLTITHNSGGTNDFMSKDGANITTAAGMVLRFRFDGTDLREIGR